MPEHDHGRPGPTNPPTYTTDTTCAMCPNGEAEIDGLCVDCYMAVRQEADDLREAGIRQHDNVTRIHQNRRTSLTLGDVAERCGITYRQADVWIRAGYVLPHLQHHGTGNHRDLTPNDALTLAVMGALTRAGINPQRAGELTPQLLANPSAQHNDHGVLIAIDWANITSQAVPA